VLGIVPRVRAASELSSVAAIASARVPRVSTGLARSAQARTRVELPGDVRAFQETAIRAQVSGYLQRLHVEMGDRVTQGQLLAEIETPVLDQQRLEAGAQLAEAEANLVEAEATVELARTTWERWRDAAARGGVSQQERDERKATFDKVTATVAARRATVASRRATVSRLEASKKFAEVRAPFGGTIVSRTFDLGALVKGDDTSQGNELFRLARTDVLRAFVNVPQTFALDLHDGLPATLSVAERPGVAFTGKLIRTAGALDRTSRTLLAEVHVPNEDGRLLPGTFAMVAFEVAREHPAVVVAANALLTRADGPRVAAVVGGKVSVRRVTLGRDLGREVEVLSGLAADETVIVNLADDLPDGAPIQVDKPAEKKK
jgi:RND family efflux transporter MFP subunit